MPSENINKKVSRDVKHTALAMEGEGMKQEDVAQILNIGVRTIQRAKSRLIRHGDVEGRVQKVGRKPKLSPEMEEV